MLGAGGTMECDDGPLPIMADTVLADREQPDYLIWLETSTVGEEATEWCAGLAGRYGVGFVDAPVLGTLKLVTNSWVLAVVEAGAETMRRLGQGTGEHGDEDISATYLTSAPDQAA